MSETPSLSRVKVWDAPVRISHWLLTLLILLQYLSGQYELLDLELHFWFGYATLSVVLFRIAWGFLGSDSARFVNFMGGPSALLRYIRTLPARAPSAWPGHNPLGGWSALLLLLLVLLQAVTGLFASDDVAYYGPLSGWISTELSELMTDIHQLNRWILLAVAAVHVGAVVFYKVYKREELLLPMVNGNKVVRQDPGLRFVGNGRAVLLAAISVALVAALVWLGEG